MIRRRMRPAHRGSGFKPASLIVSLNLQTDNRQPARGVEFRLVFSAPVRTASANTWVVFLCTNVKLSEAKILEVYALRWSIEVYFKEIKQNLGFLKEQSGRYQLAYSSVHLAAIDPSVEGLLNEALQISPQQVLVQLKAEELGYL